jgi:hypothetical protein
VLVLVAPPVLRRLVAELARDAKPAMRATADSPPTVNHFVVVETTRSP